MQHSNRWWAADARSSDHAAQPDVGEERAFVGADAHDGPGTSAPDEVAGKSPCLWVQWESPGHYGFRAKWRHARWKAYVSELQEAQRSQEEDEGDEDQEADEQLPGLFINFCTTFV